RRSRRRCWCWPRPTPLFPWARPRRSSPSSASTDAASPRRSPLPYDPEWSPGRRGSAHMNRAVACAALAAILLAACGGGGGAKKTAAKGGTTTSSEETTSTAAGSSTTAAGAAGATATTKAAAKPGTAGGPTVNGKPANNYTPPAGATPAKPTAPGTYHYDTSGSSTVGAQSSAPPSVTPLVVDPPAGTRQHSARDERDSSGNGSLTETTL